MTVTTKTIAELPVSLDGPARVGPTPTGDLSAEEIADMRDCLATNATEDGDYWHTLVFPRPSVLRRLLDEVERRRAAP